MLDEKAARLYGTQPEITAYGSLWRLPEIFLRPTAAFHELNKNPAWVAPLFAAALFRVLRLVAFQPSREPLKMLATFTIEAITFVFPVLVCSGALMLVLYLAGGETSFRRVFSVLTHTFFFYTVVSVVLAVTIHFLSPDPTSVDFQNPAFTNLGFLVRSKQHLAFNYFLSALDVVSFYHLYLIGLGLSIVSQKISFRKTMGMTAALWITYVALGVAVKFIVG